ncbi:MAG: hypothetical protein AB1324_05065 [Candidatus Micrarchaeota archaeon]
MRATAFFALLVATIFATNVNNANYQASDGTWHFDTDMQFTSDFTLSADPSDVASGNAANLQSGDAVCSGATITVTPTVTSRWATPDFAAVSIYPTCGGGFCPAMINAGGVSSNRNIRWLSGATWDNHKSFGDSNDWSQDPSRHDALLAAGGFDNQPVTWNNNTGEFHAGKEGGAAVFCKGTFEILDGATIKNSSAMPTVGAADFVVNTAGPHAISTRLSGVNCFGVVEKHPTNKVDNPSWFYFYYFTHNAPAIPAQVAADTINLTVQNSGGTVAFHETQVEASSALSDEDLVLLRVRIHNDADAIRVTSVTDNSADYTVEPFDTSTCDALGVPPALCPGSNGFNSDIPPAGNRDLYVLLERGAGASGGVTLTFHAQTVSTACGGASMGSDDVELNDDDPFTCEIEPATAEIGTLEVAQFDVECRNIANAVIPCVGNNWFWADGLAGGFIIRTNSEAQAYPTSPPGSSGTMRYASVFATCLSDVDVVQPTYECELVPATATLNISTSKHFDFNCFEEGSPSDPDSADYDLIDGLSGSTSNEADDGVDYNAPGSPDSGKLRGVGWFGSAPDPIIGAVGLANINVVNGSGGNNTTCVTPPCGPDGEGSTPYCTIGSGPFNPYQGFFGWLGIKCGEQANETCDSVIWSIVPPGIGSLSGSSNNGTFVNITGSVGSSGFIGAIVDDEGHGCTKPFAVGEQECVDVS